MFNTYYFIMGNIISWLNLGEKFKWTFKNGKQRMSTNYQIIIFFLLEKYTIPPSTTVWYDK